MHHWEPAPRDLESVECVANTLVAHDDWLIVTHERPDGDAIGSSLAIAHILSYLGKNWTFATSEPLPERFNYLVLFDRFDVVSAEDARLFHHVVAVDCADERRYLAVRNWVGDGAVIVNIDHHQTNPRYGAACLVDDKAAATCELIYHVVRQLGVPLTADLAACLYTGILTDTGGFSYPNTTGEVHRIAAELLSSGVRPYDIAEPAMEARSWEQMRLLQMALNNLTVSADGRYSALYITRGMLDGAGATDDDVEGIVGFARSIDSVEVGLLFKELADGRVKVSLRSKRTIDVARIAQHFGGGGHARAAGCELSVSLDEAMDQVTEVVELALAEGSRS